MAEDIGFYVMAAPALKGLLDEFRLMLDDKDAADAMYRYGQRCGQGLVDAMGLDRTNVVKAVDDIPMLISESGLGYGDARTHGDSVVVELSESLELTVAPSIDCSFTAGYLAGIITGYTGERYEMDAEDSNIEGRGGKFVFQKPEKTIAPQPVHAPEDDGLERGLLYVMEEERPTTAYEAFAKRVESEKGLCITRDFPKKIRKSYEFGETKIIWLSSTESEDAFDPTKLSALFYEVQMFLKENPSSTVLLSGLEYLAAQNSFLTVLKFTQLLCEQAAIHDAVFLVQVDPSAFDPKEYVNLKREMLEF